MSRRVSVVIEQDESGFCADAPDLPGCQTQGDTLEETLANIREAIELYLESLDDEQKLAATSRTVITTSVEVAVA